MDYKSKLNLLNVNQLKKLIRTYDLQTKIVMSKRKKEELIADILKHTELQDGKVILKNIDVIDINTFNIKEPKMNIKIDKSKSSFESIKNEIKESEKKVFYYDINNKLLVSASSKDEADKMLLKLKLKDGSKLLRAEIVFFSGKKAEHPTKLAVIIRTYIIDNGNIKKESWQSNSNGYIWFDDLFLERRGWANFYIPNIIKKVIAGEIKFKFGIIYYKMIE